MKYYRKEIETGKIEEITKETLMDFITSNYWNAGTIYNLMTFGLRYKSEYFEYYIHSDKS